MFDKENLIDKIDAEFLSRVKAKNSFWEIDAEGVNYRALNKLLRNLNNNGVKKMKVHNICGQRYIGTGLKGNDEIEIFGTPGNDLGAFMNGVKLRVHGNVQDGCGNTMNDGQIVVNGHAGDIAGYSMRGGKIFIRDDVGYRVGIHMKEYLDKRPYLVIGGTAQDFLGEYMAGGVLVLLGLSLKEGSCHKARFVGTGMHGGIMYIRGDVSHLGNGVDVEDLDMDDRRFLRSLVNEFCGYFGFNVDEIMDREFIKIVPISCRPYGDLYVLK